MKSRPGNSNFAAAFKIPGFDKINSAGFKPAVSPAQFIFQKTTAPAAELNNHNSFKLLPAKQENNKTGFAHNLNTGVEKNAAPVQRTILKDVTVENEILGSARDLSSQIEVDQSAQFQAGKYNTNIIKLGEKQAVTEDKPVVVVAHGTAKGKFSSYETPEKLGNVLVQQHGVYKGMSVVLEGCYSGQVDEDPEVVLIREQINRQPDSRKGKSIKKKLFKELKKKGRLTKEGRKQQRLDSFVNQIGTVIDNHHLSKENSGSKFITSVSGNPKLVFDFEDSSFDINSKENSTAMISSEHNKDLEIMEEELIEQYQVAFRPMLQITAPQSMHFLHTALLSLAEAPISNTEKKSKKLYEGEIKISDLAGVFKQIEFHPEHFVNKFGKIIKPKLDEAILQLSSSKNIKVWGPVVNGFKNLPEPALEGDKGGFCRSIRTPLLEVHSKFRDDIEKKLATHLSTLKGYRESL